MKFIFKSILLSFLILTTELYAQSHQSFKYQALVRDHSGNTLINQLVAVRISLLTGSETGLEVYIEVHSCTTNQFGMITLDIGKGLVESGNFSAINWSSDTYFLKLEIDPTGGNSYLFMGTSQLLSVPYAIHSITSERLMNLTETQRDAMTNIPIGKSFFNTTTKKINYYDGIHWFEVNGTCLPQPTQANAGPDQINLVGAITTIQANTALSGTGIWSIISGDGGYIADPLNPTTLFNGLAGTSYTLSWTISNDCSSSSDDVLVSFAPFSCGSTFKDVRDNKVYTSVLIGTQCWMAENMNIGTRIDGIENMTNNSIFEKYCQENAEANCDVYGGLYTWTEVMQYSTIPGIQGICVEGWHIPTDDECKLLEGTVDSQYGVGDPVWDLEGDRGYDAGGKLKETGTVHWYYPNTGATNSTGFTSLPGGTRNTNGGFVSFQASHRFWTSTGNSTEAFRRVIYFDRMTCNPRPGNYKLSVIRSDASKIRSTNIQEHSINFSWIFIKMEIGTDGSRLLPRLKISSFKSKISLYNIAVHNNYNCSQYF